MAHPKGPRHSIELNLLHEASITSDSDAEEDCPSAFGSHEFSSGINLDAIKSAKKVDSAVAHQVETKRSILALVIDDGYLIAGLEGGDIVVGVYLSLSVHRPKNLCRSLDNVLVN